MPLPYTYNLLYIYRLPLYLERRVSERTTNYTSLNNNKQSRLLSIKRCIYKEK